MPHQRTRSILKTLEKRLRLFPVVGVLGARQTGKSTLLRELLPALRSIHYVTLDRLENRTEANERPSLFLQGLEDGSVQTVCIDEAQKAPPLFDTLKAEVDEKKRPGRFALSGSTEFSKKTGIHEALTGRIALLRLFPLNISEIENQKSMSDRLLSSKNLKKGVSPCLKAVKQWFQCGGMPGIFAIREEANRRALFEAWIETTCTRDLAQFRIPRFDPELALKILEAMATEEVPNQLGIARKCGRLPRQIEPYLEAFQALFVVYKVPPYPTGTGKPLFHLFDAGIARTLGASAERCMEGWFLNECYSQFSAAGKALPRIHHYVSSRGSRVHFVVEQREETYAVCLSNQEAQSTYSLRAARSFSAKHPKVPVFVMAPALESHALEKNIRIVPW